MPAMLGIWHLLLSAYRLKHPLLLGINSSRSPPSGPLQKQIRNCAVWIEVGVWKNFENGKVYSHKMPNEKSGGQTHAARKAVVGEERLLHSHHRDKKMKAGALQATDSKPIRSKNPERHHRKSIEEEMHLRPLNERHHKFPNPALLDKMNDGVPPDSKISKQNLLKRKIPVT
ncbi:uncharacterized protein CDAR_574011 [Caerostris darwini]|uniref:Uncharacterized protein n=1 Tax=Caerostris darwini TaxID=1538125 RepID=A0AAV4T715_9ARAC|nr:uncharacterized protein CDAR_574011 [Caerostris darwini]